MVAFLILNLSCNPNDIISPAPPPNFGSVDHFSYDVQVLAARFSTSPWIDSILASEIDVALRSARSVRSDLAGIRIYGSFVLTQLIVEPVPEVAEKWSQGNILVEDPYLDSLATLFGLELVIDSKVGWFILNFHHSLNVPVLAKVYAQSSKIVYAQPNGLVGDGDEIWLFIKNTSWDFVFSHGEGDCPSGCLWRNFVYVVVDPLNSGSLIRELDPPYQPQIFLWNVPPRYIATLYSSAQDILDHYRDGDWWRRQQAIEVTWRLFVNTTPWDGADLGPHQPLWDSLRTQMLARRDEVVNTLLNNLNDQDGNVHGSILIALSKISP